MSSNTLISAATLAVGILMLLASFWYFSKKKSDYRSSITTLGTVKSLKAVSSTFVSTDIDGDLTLRQEENIFKGDAFAPVVEFTTTDGKTVEFTGASSKPPRYKVGDKINILYQQERPEKAVIDSFLNKWIVAIFLFSFSSFTVLTGGLLLVFLV